MPVPVGLTSSRRVPAPVPVLTVTKYCGPDPLTPVTLAPLTVPVVVRAKSPTSTPVTDALK